MISGKAAVDGKCLIVTGRSISFVSFIHSPMFCGNGKHNFVEQCKHLLPKACVLRMCLRKSKYYNFIFEFLIISQLKMPFGESGTFSGWENRGLQEEISGLRSHSQVLADPE